MRHMNSGSPATLSYPISERTLDNGLRVIASPDHVGQIERLAEVKEILEKG